MNHILMTQGVRYDLFLADGSRWRIAAGNEEAISIVSQLGCIMQLRMCSGASENSNHGNLNHLLVKIDTHAPVTDWYVPLASENDGVVVCVLRPSDFWGGSYVNLVRLSLILAHESQAHGGVLVHGALAERDGMGVILAAPGGRGKTTASNRLPVPWRSLCDDTTLVVRNPQGDYWAHPWPTWSRFLDGGPGGTWDVQKAVPVKGIFFLVQAGKDRVDRVDPGQAVGLLEESVGQTSAFMASGLCKEEIRALHLEQFNNLCTLARVIPTHTLRLSLTGTFWQEIEQTLGRTA
jgi:SynChlorMet cassette protein ScmC